MPQGELTRRRLQNERSSEAKEIIQGIVNKLHELGLAELRIIKLKEQRPELQHSVKDDFVDNLKLHAGG